MYPTDVLTIILFLSVHYDIVSFICQLGACYILLPFLFCLGLTLINTTN